jgi:hypothetical protein
MNKKIAILHYPKYTEIRDIAEQVADIVADVHGAAPYISPNYEQIKAMAIMDELEAIIIVMGGINCGNTKEGLVSGPTARSLLQNYTNIPILVIYDKRKDPQSIDAYNLPDTYEMYSIISNIIA